ncbi:MAG: hypothetical protein ACTSW0_11675 [Candidatus Heimdallarchaeota archaeon]
MSSNTLRSKNSSLGNYLQNHQRHYPPDSCPSHGGHNVCRQFACYYGSVLYSYLVISIIPEEFATIAHFEKNYLDSNPEAFFARIQSSSEVLMQKDEAQ